MRWRDRREVPGLEVPRERQIVATSREVEEEDGQRAYSGCWRGSLVTPRGVPVAETEGRRGPVRVGLVASSAAREASGGTEEWKVAALRVL